MRKSRLTFAASLLAATALTLTACGSSDDADSAETAAETAAESSGDEAEEGKGFGCRSQVAPTLRRE